MKPTAEVANKCAGENEMMIMGDQLRYILDPRGASLTIGILGNLTGADDK